MNDNNTTDALAQETPDPKEEERKSISRKRIFWVVVALDVIVAILIFYEILSLFF